MAQNKYMPAVVAADILKMLEIIEQALNPDYCLCINCAEGGCGGEEDGCICRCHDDAYELNQAARAALQRLKTGWG